MKILVAIHLDLPQPEVEYTLATLLEVAGLPFEFVSSPTDLPWSEAIWLHYGTPGRDDLSGDSALGSAVVIPAGDGVLWRTIEPEHVMLDGVPVLLTGEAPLSLHYQRGTTVCLSFDLVRAAFWLLSRQEELGEGNRDPFGRFECSRSWLMRHDLAEVPIVDHYAALLARVLAAAAQSQGMPLLRKLPWPHGQPYAVILSHDVDDAGRFSPRQGWRLLSRAVSQRSVREIARGAYFAAAGLGRSLLRATDPYWNFEAVLDLEARAGFRSTFFFVPEAQSVKRDPPYDIDAPRLRNLLVRLQTGGWEVGVHGSFDSYLDAKVLRAQREKLERALGSPVRGVRQHYLRLRIPDTFRSHVEAGFVYDSTLGFRGGVGFRAGTAFPFRPFDAAARQPLSILELPLTIMDGALFWQLGLTPPEATARSLALLETIRSVGGLAVLLWHQRAWHDRRYPGWSHVYRQAVEYLRDEDLAWVATAGQVAGWWQAREAVRLERSSADGVVWRYGYRTGQAMEGLAFALTGAGSGQVRVLGAAATVREIGGGEFWLLMDSLVAGQSFEIVWTREGETA